MAQEQFLQKALDCVVGIDFRPLGDKGEDAFAYDFHRGSLHALSVFDGCGGAGAWQYAEFRQATGALVASNVIARAAMDWYGTLTAEDAGRVPELAARFSSLAGERLTALKNSCAPMELTGSLVKSFPTTASIALVTPGGGGSALLTALNVGDSRVYFMTPDDGLVQLTTDDSRGKPDPMESLIDSAPLSDMLNADRPFSVKARQVRLSGPFAVLCATDGVFGYLRSPMDFEYLLLNTLMNAGTMQIFESGMQRAMMELSGDDATAVMAFYNWGSMDRIKQLMEGRFSHVSGLIRQINGVPEEETENMLRAVWADYRETAVFDRMQE